MPAEPRPPIVLAMVLADTVLVDVTTGKNTIQETYQSLLAPAFPYTQAAIVGQVVLTEGVGRRPCGFAWWIGMRRFRRSSSKCQTERRAALSTARDAERGNQGSHGRATIEKTTIRRAGPFRGRADAFGRIT